MITATISVRVDRNGLRGQVARDAAKFCDRVNKEIAVRARTLAPNATGDLRRSIRPVDAKRIGPTRVRGRVEATAPHAVYQHEGTGMFGPRRRRIRPVRARALRFVWREAGGLVFFRSVKGTPGTKYLVRAVEELLPEPPWRIRYFTTLIPGR